MNDEDDALTPLEHAASVALIVTGAVLVVLNVWLLVREMML